MAVRTLLAKDYAASFHVRALTSFKTQVPKKYLDHGWTEKSCDLKRVHYRGSFVNSALTVCCTEYSDPEEFEPYVLVWYTRIETCRAALSYWHAWKRVEGGAG